MKSISFSAPLILAAASDGKPRRFSIEPAYGGGELRVKNFALPVVIDLAGMSVDERCIATLDHIAEKRVGHVDAHTNDGKQLSLSGVVSSASESASEFLRTADFQFPWQASVEVDPSELVDVNAKQKVKVNGRVFIGPVTVAAKSILIGVSFVSRGADRGTRVHVA